MRIAFFTDTFHPNIDGVVTHILSASRRLAEQGHQILIIAPQYQKNKIKLHPNIVVKRVPSFPVPQYREFRFVLPLKVRCRTFISEFRPELIHIHSYSTLGFLGSSLAQELAIPLIGTYHTLISEFSMYLSPWRFLGMGNIAVSAARNKRSKKSMIKEMIWKVSLVPYQKCDVIIAPSKSIGHLLKKRLGREVKVICSGIRLDEFVAKQVRPTREPINFLHVGRLSFEKEIDTVIQAFHIVAGQGIDFDLSIIGNGPARKSLEMLVSKYGLEREIRFLGFVSQEKLIESYRAHDVFVTASAMETLGMVILESLACGTPVIAVDANAAPDIVKEGYNGYIARPHDPQSLARAIVRAIRNKERIPVLGRNALESVKRCDANANMEILAEIYQKAIAGKKPPLELP